MGRLRILLVALAVAGLAACGEKSVPKPAPKGEAFKTAAVELRDVELTTSAEAVMEAVRQSTVSAQIAGRIVELRFDVGDYVKKGDVIVRIDERSAARALEASEAQVLEAQAALANARANYERSKQLLVQKFISQAALDQAEAAYKSAQARVGALLAGAGAAATERSFATVVAPYSGVVSARHIELGEMATPGRPLMTGFDPSTLRVVATVPQAQVAAIQAGGKARIEVPSLGRWVEVKAMTIVPAADPRTHTTRVRLELPAEVRGVYPGVYARAHFVIGKAPRLLVPRAAVLHRSEVTAVYVVDERGGAQLRPQLRQIRLGSAGDEASVEVLAGLKPGERVALEPVKAGMATPGA
jgi:RND family efflux transporter MFP subunit